MLKQVKYTPKNTPVIVWLTNQNRINQGIDFIHGVYKHVDVMFNMLVA